MRKHLLTICLLVFFTASISAQINDEIAWKHVERANKEIKTAKGKKRVDCLNLLAESYRWIWDDNDKHLDTACMYAKQALEEAKKLNYKAGIGYAKATMSPCIGGRIDNNRNNNDQEPAYSLMYKHAEEVLTIAAQLKDEYLSGLVYYYLAWSEKWWGSPEKFKATTQKAIEHLEKIKGNEFNDTYRPLMLAECNDCKGSEALLGWLYMDLARTVPVNNSLREAHINKAIQNLRKGEDKSSLARAYIILATELGNAGKIEPALNYLNEAIFIFREDKNEQGEADVYNTICSGYFNWGDFEKGIEYSKKNIELAEKLARENGTLQGKNNRLYQAYYWMGRFYAVADDTETALGYMRKALYHSPNENTEENSKTAIAEIHRALGNYDSAMHYLSFTLKKEGGIGKRILSSLYISMKQYDKGLDIINNRLKNILDGNDLVNYGKTLTLAAKAYYGKNEYGTALKNAREGFAFLKITSRNFSLAENYQLLSDIFSKLGQHDSAYYYLKQYTELKETLLKKQLYIKLSDYKKEAEEAKRIGQINLLQKNNLIKEQELRQQRLLKEQNEAQLSLLDKSNQIKDQQLLIKDQHLKEQTLLKEQNRSQLTLLDKENKLKDGKLKQQAFLRNALLAGLLLLILLGIFVLRSISLKRKNEKLAIGKTQAELLQKMSGLEMQALRAQMNPHFIFNCLSSINRFILKNETKVASNYLTRFSRLMRMVLNNSQKPLVALDDELEMLGLYLEMERLRFKNSFDYGITFLNAIDSDNIFIPPLLLQPFCENAIWHGLMHKEGHGRLDIELGIEDNILICSIADNGVGRQKAEELNSKTAEKEKSMGLKITTERLGLLNREKGLHTFYEIEDRKDEKGNAAGTRVILRISVNESMAEAV